MHGLRRPSYDLLKSPDSYKRHSVQTPREITTSNVKDYLAQYTYGNSDEASRRQPSPNSRHQAQYYNDGSPQLQPRSLPENRGSDYFQPPSSLYNRSSSRQYGAMPRAFAKKGSIANYFATRLSLIPSDIDTDEYDRYYHGVKRYDWVIYFGIFVACIVFFLALAMIYVISSTNQNFKIHSYRSS